MTALALLAAPPCGADQADHQLEPMIVFCPSEGWPPYFITSDDTRVPSGIMFDVLQAIASGLGHTIQPAIFPEKRGQMLLEQGKLDAFPKAREWMPGADSYLWTDPVIESVDVVISSAAHHLDFQTPDDLLGRDIAVVRGYAYPKLDDFFQSGAIHCHEAKDSRSILRMVQHERVHGAVMNRSVAQWIIRNSKQLRNENFYFSPTPLDSAAYRFAFINEPRWERFVPLFNAELALMKEDGRLDAIIAKYK